MIVEEIRKSRWLPQMSLDANGNIKTHTDRNGSVSAYNYDNLDRIIRISRSGGGTKEYTYDAAGIIEDDSSYRLYFQDELGSPIRIADEAGKVREVCIPRSGSLYPYKKCAEY